MAEIGRLDKKASPTTAYYLQEILFKYEHRLKEQVFKILIFNKIGSRTKSITNNIERYFMRHQKHKH